ncbi:MAG: trimeric intracellular cation channel family protein [Clostridia bacterium]|nr:trimeric intracellular cation channel family protein [Clostridia bacterium]
MSETLLLIFECIGTVSFAVSGAMTAIAKKMDIFGVMILGIITAVGGGVLRDVTLGIIPPRTFENPLYAGLSAATALVVFLPQVRRWLTRQQHIYETALLVMDALGLGVFTVVGIRTAVEAMDGFNVFLLLFVGLITGIGGGVLRDVLASDTPYIFVKHFYATASLLGAALCIGLWQFAGEAVAMLSGAALVVVLRLLAARFHWNLPRPQ